jgi:hypothetical protein
MTHFWNSTSSGVFLPQATFIATAASTASPNVLPRPVTESHTMLPPTITQKELRKYTAKDWAKKKPEIERLYKDNTLESVRAFMKRHHGLEAT